MRSLIVALCLVASAAFADSQRRSPTSCENIALTGSDSAWSNPGDAVSSNNVRAKTAQMAVGEYSDTLLCHYSFTFPTGSTACKFNIENEAQNANGWIKVRELRIHRPTGGNSGSHHETGHWTGSDQVYGYPTGSTDGPEDFDDWGEAAMGFTYAACDASQTTCATGVLNVNHPEIGASLVAEVYPGSGAATPRVDHLELLIWCTPPAP